MGARKVERCPYCGGRVVREVAYDGGNGEGARYRFTLWWCEDCGRGLSVDVRDLPAK
jgi:uncharacterized protein with PIN domain